MKTPDQIRAEVKEKMHIDGYMTQEEYDHAKKEVERLKGPETERIEQELAIARSYGNLSENAEYEYMRDELYYLQVSIRSWEETVEEAEVLTKEEWEKEEERLYQEIEKRERKQAKADKERLARLSVEEIVEDFMVGTTLANSGTWAMGEIAVTTEKLCQELRLQGFFGRDYNNLLEYTKKEDWFEAVRAVIDCFIEKHAFLHAYTALLTARDSAFHQHEMKETWMEEMEAWFDQMGTGEVCNSKGELIGYMEHRLSGTTSYYLACDDGERIMVDCFEAEYEEAPEEVLFECWSYVEF